MRVGLNLVQAQNGQSNSKQNNQQSFGQLSTKLLRVALSRAGNDPMKLDIVKDLVGKASTNKDVHVGVTTYDNWTESVSLRSFSLDLFDNFKARFKDNGSRDLKGSFSSDDKEFFLKIGDAINEAEGIVKRMSPEQKLRNQLVLESVEISHSGERF